MELVKYLTFTPNRYCTFFSGISKKLFSDGTSNIVCQRAPLFLLEGVRSGCTQAGSN